MQPIFDNIQIKDHLLKGIETAQHSLEVAVAWFTDPGLFQPLIEAAQRGVRVCILLHQDAINLNARIDWDDLTAVGGALYWHSPPSGTMHHKFCIVDGKTCFFGTYNWTIAASSMNRESLLVIHDEQMANSFRSELEKLLLNPFTSLHSGSINYSLQNGIMVHPGPELLRMEIALLELEIAELEVQVSNFETQLQQHEAILQSKLGDLLLEHIQLKQQLAEAKARLTMKQVYQDEAKTWREEYIKTNAAIQDSKNRHVPVLEDDQQQEMSRMYKEALFKIHPDRYTNDPEKQALATRLTQELVAAFKAADFSRVQEIWQSVQEGWVFLSDILLSNDWDLLHAYLQRLKIKQVQLLSSLDFLRAHELIRALDHYPDFSDYVERCRQQLLLNINDLKTEIQSLNHE